ncbi:MAG: ketohexokinase [Gammaproteobacteria bacterium]|nr:MAG: ketohexokinase [Gammaproteobacteria bacterium]
MPAVLGVGVAVLDRLLLLERFPEEDAELRAVGQALLPGGNAANTLLVLARLGHRCSLLAPLAQDAEAGLLAEALARRGLDLAACPRLPGRTPTSCILLSRATGSRTILHHRELPELEAAHLDRVPVEAYAWLHFEGRNPEQTGIMLRRARARAPGARRSLELEKARPGLEPLLPLADLLILSRAFARALGLAGPEAALAWARERAPRALVAVPWGEEGAWGQAPGEAPVRVPAARPSEVVDTRAAGDSFAAGLIHALLAGRPLAGALGYAAALAGAKCASLGLDDFPLPPLPPLREEAC